MISTAASIGSHCGSLGKFGQDLGKPRNDLLGQGRVVDLAGDGTGAQDGYANPHRRGFGDLQLPAEILIEPELGKKPSSPGTSARRGDQIHEGRHGQHVLHDGDGVRHGSNREKQVYSLHNVRARRPTCKAGLTCLLTPLSPLTLPALRAGSLPLPASGERVG